MGIAKSRLSLSLSLSRSRPSSLYPPNPFPPLFFLTPSPPASRPSPPTSLTLPRHHPFRHSVRSILLCLLCSFAVMSWPSVLPSARSVVLRSVSLPPFLPPIPPSSKGGPEVGRQARTSRKREGGCQTASEQNRKPRYGGRERAYTKGVDRKIKKPNRTKHGP